MTAHRRTRMARLFVAAVVCGACLVAGSPAYAISGTAGQAHAAQGEYLSPSVDPPPPGENIPLGEETPGGQGAPGVDPEGVVLPTEASAAPGAPGRLSADDGLPLTGYGLVAVLIAGLIALLAGVVLRRQTAPTRGLT